MRLREAMRPLSIRDVTITDRFWLPKLEQLTRVTLPSQFEKIAGDTGRLENFRRTAIKKAGDSPGAHQGRYYDDSDVYKWCEASAYALAHVDSPLLRQQLNEVIDAIESAQDDDGYLVTYFQLQHPDLKFRNLSYMHELYCMGHLIEAGVALDEALGDGRLLQVAIRAADLLVERFGEGKEVGYCGHSEIEFALLRLSMHVSVPVYAELAERMMRLRGQKPSRFEAELEDESAMALSPWAKQYLNLRGDYFQDHAPLPEHSEMVGHAVRGMYLYTGAVALSNEPEWEAMLRRVWQNLVERRLYVTGGTGSSPKNEGFTRDYDLPNLDSYAETCAAVALIFWGRELTCAWGESEFIDVAELALFNAALAGLSEDGKGYFYANPLESRGNNARSAWFDCACCPPNIARLIGSVHSLAVAELIDGDGACVQIPIAGTYRLNDGSMIEIASNYPASGSFSIRFQSNQPREFELRIRIPSWTDEMSAEIANTPFQADFESGYAIFKRTWNPGETLAVEWEMEPKWLESHPLVFDNLGCSALARGPLIYCLETLEHEPPAQFFVAAIDSEVSASDSQTLLGPKLTVEGFQLIIENNSSLYSDSSAAGYVPTTQSFVPYAAWSNQGPSHMRVWVRSMAAGEGD